MGAVYIPNERRKAWERYERKFGVEWPAYYTHAVYGDDWQAEVKHINRCIAENKPAPYKELDPYIDY